MKKTKIMASAFVLVLASLTFTVSSAVVPTAAHAQKKRGTSIKLNDIKVVGKIQKPQAFYVLHRAPLNYKNFRLKRSFLKKVIDAVKRKPF